MSDIRQWHGKCKGLFPEEDGSCITAHVCTLVIFGVIRDRLHTFRQRSLTRSKWILLVSEKKNSTFTAVLLFWVYDRINLMFMYDYSHNNLPQNFTNYFKTN